MLGDGDNKVSQNSCLNGTYIKQIKLKITVHTMKEQNKDV